MPKPATIGQWELHTSIAAQGLPAQAQSFVYATKAKCQAEREWTLRLNGVDPAITVKAVCIYVNVRR